MTDRSNVNEELARFVDQIESCESEKQSAQDAIRDIYAEAKGRGYDTKVLRKVVARRKKDREAIANEDATLAIYEDAISAARAMMS